MGATRSCTTSCPCKSGYGCRCKKQLQSEYRSLAGLRGPGSKLNSYEHLWQQAERSTFSVAMLASLEPRSGAVDDMNKSEHVTWYANCNALCYRGGNQDPTLQAFTSPSIPGNN